MTLDETGYLHCAYLGTDPSMMVTPAPEARDINYEVSVAHYNVFILLLFLNKSLLDTGLLVEAGYHGSSDGSESSCH